MTRASHPTPDDFARLLLALAQDSPALLTPDEAEAIREFEAEIERGERVPAESIEAFWRAHGV